MPQANNASLTTIEFRRARSGTEFLGWCGNWLHQDDARNNVILSVAPLTERTSSIFKPPYWFGVISENNIVRGCGLYADPDGLCISEMDDKSVATLVEQVLADQIPISRINGSVRTATLAATLIEQATGIEFSIDNHWDTLVLKKPIRPKKVAAGGLRLASSKEAKAVDHLARQFEDESPALVDVASYLRNKLENDLLWVWDDGKIVTLIAMSERTQLGVRLAAVFTPTQFRGNSYASNAVWSVSNNYLNDGCSYTLLDVDHRKNTKSRLYRNIGYVKVGERISMVPN